MRIAIIANGIMENPQRFKKEILEADGIICLDGGLRYAKAMEIVPQYILGDFDSVDERLLKQFEIKNCVIERYPARKDFTDMEIGIDFAIHKGAEEVYIYGALGGRMDHAMANVYAMVQAVDQGIYPVMVGEKERLFITDRPIELSASPGTILSLIPITNKVTGISTKGLEYPLVNETLYMGFARGVSNVFQDKEVKVSFKDGLLLVILNY